MEPIVGANLIYFHQPTQPLIYVTMGSTIEAQPVLVKIIDALRDAPYNIVISTGDLSLPTKIGLPPHIRIFPVVPGAAVVQRSAAVIHHGGHETLMQVLAAGVPSLIVPANPDQILVAQQAQALGVGHSLWRPNGLPLGVRSLDGMTVTEIRRAVDDLLDDQDCVRACETLKEEIAGYCGAKTAADILEGVVL
jgi:UDP:flavonoid glycosyltransferase YjiC (YdhE family)